MAFALLGMHCPPAQRTGWLRVAADFALDLLKSAISVLHTDANTH